MKKCLIISLLVSIVCLIILLALQKDYTKKDVDKCLDIYLEKIEPTKKDFKRYDFNNDNQIKLNDCVAVLNKVK